VSGLWADYFAGMMVVVTWSRLGCEEIEEDWFWVVELGVHGGGWVEAKQRHGLCFMV
jgi:hypothetical protein